MGKLLRMFSGVYRQWSSTGLVKETLSLFLVYLFIFTMLADPALASPSYAPARASFADSSAPAPAPPQASQQTAGNVNIQTSLANQQPQPTTTPQTGSGSPNSPVPSNSPAPQQGSTNPNSPPFPVSQPPGTGYSGSQYTGSNSPQASGPECSASELSPQETQNLIDLLKKGFTVDANKGIVGIPKTDKDRPKLASDELVLQDPQDANVAVKAKIPNLKMSPAEIAQFLNTYVRGPFAFGVVLDDSLRAGRCKDFSSPDCSLTGPNLRYRNSGAGILADTKPVQDVFKDVMSSWTDKNLTTSKTQFTKQEDAVLQAALSTDANVDQTQIKTAKRLQKQLIPNSILAGTFTATMATNCTSSACVISTYSLFDKYFNSWQSTEMVASSFGPSLLYYTKRLFGWTGRRGIFAGVKDEYQNFLDLLRKKYVNVDTVAGKFFQKRLQNRLDKYGWREWYMSLAAGNANGTGYNLVKTEEFQHFWAKAQEPNGFLSHIKTQEERAEFIRMLQDMRTLVRSSKARVQDAKDAWALAEASPALGPDNPVTSQKYIEYGQEFAKMMLFYDDALMVDVPEWMVRHNNVGFYNKGLNQIRPDGGSEVIDMFREHRNFQRVVKKFADDGTFKGFEQARSAGFDSVYQTNGDNLVYYTFDTAGAKEEGLSWGNIKPQAAGAPGRIRKWIKDDYGEYIPYHDVSAEFIQSRVSRGALTYTGNWKVGGEITPADFTARITNGRTRPNVMEFGVTNVEQMLDTLKERNWVSRRYWNALDKLTAQEDELVRSYFSIKGGVKWTTIPFGYWWAKRGFGIDGISEYQLPETWHDIKITHGQQQVYDYSYVDFFANEGSDAGDIFVQVLNKLPWKVVLDNLSDKYSPVKDLYNQITGQGIRSTTESLAFYLTGPEECVDCTVVMPTQDLQEFHPFFYADNKKFTSYILEDTKSDTAKNQGQVLIAFAGHDNLSGKSGNSTGTSINLADAINGKADQKTCDQAVKDLHFYGINIGQKLPSFLTKNGRIGGTLAGLESITYVTFLWAGIFSTVAIQVSIAPQLHDCIDASEGYYIHYFMPAKPVTEKQASTSDKSTEKVQTLVKNAKEKLFDQFSSGTQGSFASEAKDTIGTQLDKFTQDAKDNSIVQATLSFDGTSAGQLDSKELFYLWFGKGADINPANYRDKGREQLRGVNDTNVDIDFAKGTISANGQPIIDKPDNVRLAPINLAIPAVEIPHTVTESCLNNSGQPVIQISAQGNVTVLNPDLLDCIRNGVMQQTGLPLNSDNLSEAFGRLETVVTTTHPNVQPAGDRIIAEGVPRKIAQGSSATITIYANKDVNLSNSNDGSTSIGKLQSLQFANGIIVVKPNGCFLAWLKHHENGILPKDLVQGIKTSLDRTLNPQTSCMEPALNLQVTPDQSSDFKVNKVDQFNAALRHEGPFTVFETPTKRYVISSEPDETGKCQDHLRVIDKATGKVTDYTGTISQTPTGLKITTPDGQTHTLDFSTKDGAPFVQLDQNKPEPLTSAQGKNGSFYYDPEKGLWFAENANLLPLIDAFKQGIAAKVGPNGETTATAQGNILNLQVGNKGDNSFLNLSSLPENPVALALFIAMMVVAFVWVRRKNDGED